MRRYLAILTLTLSLGIGGCADFSKAFDSITGVVIAPNVALVPAYAFNALEATATNYIRLKRCTELNRPVCRDPKIAEEIVIPAVRAGRLSRDNLVTFVQEHPNKLGVKGLYDAMLSANTLLTSIFAEHQIGSR